MARVVDRVTRTSTMTALAIFAALGSFGACGDDSEVTGVGGVIANPAAPLVSDPLSLGLTTASRLSAAQRAPASSAERLVYVSLPGGSYTGGVSATIRNTAGGPTLTQTMANGGFDPIAIPAGVGDTILIDVRTTAGPGPHILLAVPRRRAPGVVRTQPPKGKRDVSLNSRVTIVFSEPIQPATLTSSSITLFRGGSIVPSVVTLLPGGVVAELIPSDRLAALATYRLELTQGILDLEGDALGAAPSLEFTTGTTARPPVTDVRIEPTTATLEMGDVQGETVQLVATVRTAQGIVGDREVIWSTSDPTVAVVSSSGLVTPLGVGDATITARSEGIEGSAEITVVPIPVASLSLGSSTLSVGVGGNLYLFAIPLDRFGRALTRRAMEWRSADPAVATVDQRGLVIGQAPGRTTITVTSEGVSGAAAVAVGPPVTDRVDISPPATALSVDGTVQLTARAYRCDGETGGCNELAGQPVNWSSDDPAMALVDQTGRVSALRSGTVTIIATVDGIRGTAPVTVLPIVPLSFASASAGSYFTCGLTPGGQAYCWGQNTYGQLGMRRRTLAPEVAPGAVGPVAVPGGLVFASLSVGGWHVCGLTSGGETYCWGLALQRQVGFPAPSAIQTCEMTDDQSGWPCVPVPTRVTGVPAFRALYAGGLHTCALTPTGRAYCWGSDRYGQVGDGGGATSHALAPTPVAGDLSFASLSGGWRHMCGITTEGKAYCWGYNYHGQLGDGTRSNRDAPVAVAGTLTFSAAAAGSYHSCGVTTSGDAYCWGDNYYGQLGDGTRAERNGPVRVAGGLTFATVSVGEWYSCGVTTSGIAYCWGGNWSGTLGDGSSANRDVPVAVAGGHAFTAIASAGGGVHTCGLASDGAVYCWGWNQSGQLGDGSVTDRRIPVRVAGQP
jgi:alpha-tubulin suppressor-like RCC1 family protein